MNFAQRIFGIFFTPKKTCLTLASRPAWLDAFTLLLAALLIFTYCIVPYTGMLDTISNSTRTIIFLRAVLLTHLYFLGFLITCLILLILGRVISRGGNYVQVFSVFVHANLIDKTLGNAVRLGFLHVNKSVFRATTSIAQFFPDLDTQSLSYAAAVQVDLFQIWFFGVLGLGLSAIFKMDLKKALCLSYGFWLLKCILNIALIHLGMGIYRQSIFPII